jgi:phosphatidate phosphatase APP1
LDDDDENDDDQQEETTYHRLPVSAKTGHFQGTIAVSKEETKHLTDGLLPIKVSAPDGRSFRGEVHLVPSTGLSVISDIDDTIKISNVKDKKSLLRNTFLEDFKEVPGMAQIYDQWKCNHGAKFHFVSSSPYQLYDELETFRKRAGFPAATFHLKRIRPKDYKILLKLFASPLKAKIATITSIIDRFPGRTFVLVGDSGEKDPEVYGNLARMYPKQIVQVYIRNVSSAGKEGFDDDRMEAAFAGVPLDKWSLFDDATEIQLPNNVVL